MDSAKDIISHQAVANILHGKSFPAWSKVEVMTAALLHFANVEVTNQEIAAIRELWLAAHYEEQGAAPSVSFLSGPTSSVGSRDDFGSLLETDLYPLTSSFDAETVEAQKAENAAGDEEGHDASQYEELFVRFIAQPLAGPSMFSIDLMAGTLQVIVNTEHPMGSSILHVMENGDERSSRLMKNLLVSWARMEDEIPSSKQRNSVAMIRHDWGRYARWLEVPGDDD
ncbi:hypothetical protein ACIRUL_11545 [Streptomyces sp. NPDC101171]|jgi:hypothetical protein|uniref:hypothetical protein n=1 Tax=Streptomyces TaxID=1883 RepID=UPI00346AC595